jgi:hypothetical protein
MNGGQLSLLVVLGVLGVVYAIVMTLEARWLNRRYDPQEIRAREQLRESRGRAGLRWPGRRPSPFHRPITHR